MTELEFSLLVSSDRNAGKKILFDAQKIICVGYAGRNQAEVRKHIEELLSSGVPPPPTIPAKYVLPGNLLTDSSRIHVQSDKTSGEVEAVLLRDKDDIYVGIGSDHTDREIEKSDVAHSKEICPKPIGSSLWLYDDVVEHWDELVARSTMEIDGKTYLYQSSKLRTLLKPADILEIAGDEIKGDVIYCGTTPLLHTLTFCSSFKIELIDPIRGCSLQHEYQVLLDKKV